MIESCASADERWQRNQDLLVDTRKILIEVKRKILTIKGNIDFLRGIFEMGCWFHFPSWWVEVLTNNAPVKASFVQQYFHVADWKSQSRLVPLRSINYVTTVFSRLFWRLYCLAFNTPEVSDFSHGICTLQSNEKKWFGSPWLLRACCNTMITYWEHEEFVKKIRFSVKYFFHLIQKTRDEFS